MGVENKVFASESERMNYYKLARTWGNAYSIYHNLPFLNIFNTRNLLDISDWSNAREIVLTDLEIARLKKTSVDYTLCDKQDKPILCIEFDGLQQGINVGTKYHPDTRQGPPNPWRQQITELKLKVALGSLFPFFVVGSNQFDDIHQNVKLTIVDAIIGEILSWKATRIRISKGFDPHEVGYDEKTFDLLPEGEKQDIIQDWVIGIEVEAEMENNPVVRKRAQMQHELSVRSWSHQFLTHPSLDNAKTMRERANGLNNALYYGSKITLHTSDYGDVQATAWLPNFNVIGYSGLTLSEDIAMILALEKLKLLRASRT